MKQTMKFLFAAVAAIMLSGTVAMAQYDARTNKLLEQASDLEDEEKYAEAAKIYQILADQGNDVAQFSLAEYYIEGKGVEKNEQLGFKYATLAADQGHGHAAGMVLFHHADNPQAYFACAKKFAGQNFDIYSDKRKFPLIFGNDDAVTEYAKCFLYGFGTKKDEDFGWQLIESSHPYDMAEAKGYADYWHGKQQQAGARDSVAFAIHLFKKQDYTTLARYAHFLYEQAGGVGNDGNPYGKDAFGCAIIAWSLEWGLEHTEYKDDEQAMAEQYRESQRDLIRLWTSIDDDHFQGGKIPMGKYLHDLYTK